MTNCVGGKVKTFDDVELFYKKSLVERPKAVLVVVHGLCEHLGRYNYFTEKLNDFGYNVYRFDNRGHGKSGGERGYVENFQYFFDDADLFVNMAKKENEGIPVFMFGHSMGGFITAGYGMKYPDKLNGQILSGAAVIDLPAFKSIKNSIDFDKNPFQKVPNVLSNLICRDPEVVKAYDEDPLVLKESNVKLLGEAFVKGPVWIENNVKKYKYPCLILHGGNDQIVTNEASKWFYKNISSEDKNLKIYPGCYHEILNEKDEKDVVIEDIHSWIEKRI
ncbi:alpha/beta hydrolase [Clostridium sp. MT-14]|uniref:Alpha/beta hydrolase n=1 Tax=Clostridium aromativorans TaxID=2836848 RepID=A0ABS8N8D3_9CLOT|nr:alpha/beta hydrolase [Clostridium aromativorans]MCC9294993.1 alpha/beta hydrolase [Clostridium aromativorans]